MVGSGGEIMSDSSMGANPSMEEPSTPYLRSWPLPGRKDGWKSFSKFPGYLKTDLDKAKLFILDNQENIPNGLAGLTIHVNKP